MRILSILTHAVVSPLGVVDLAVRGLELSFSLPPLGRGQEVREHRILLDCRRVRG